MLAYIVNGKYYHFSAPRQILKIARSTAGVSLSVVQVQFVRQVMLVTVGISVLSIKLDVNLYIISSDFDEHEEFH